MFFCTTGGFCRVCSSTLPDDGELLLDIIASANDVIMNRLAAMVVAFDSTVAPPRGPNTVCEPIPPNAPAKSAAFPLCSKTTRIKMKQMITWIVVTRYTMPAASIAVEGAVQD